MLVCHAVEDEIDGVIGHNHDVGDAEEDRFRAWEHLRPEIGKEDEDRRVDSRGRYEPDVAYDDENQKLASSELASLPLDLMRPEIERVSRITYSTILMSEAYPNIFLSHFTDEKCSPGEHITAAL